jgi:predicted hotdog family 3-hydroxylacyl-ACP dehydratase
MVEVKLSRVQIAQLLPHTGDMVLLDAVTGWDERRIDCEIRNHTEARNPLRRNDRLPAMAALEYAAQAMAVHTALSHGGQALPSGVLASIRDLRLNVDRLDDVAGPLRVSAEQRYAADSGFAYVFELHGTNGLLASGQLTVMGGDVQ